MRIWSARWVVIALAVLAPVLAACGRPTGDFGRARPSVLHDVVAPAAGTLIAEEHRGETVSRFNLTDTEGELRDRAWTLVRPPHLGDWWLDTLVEGQRTRIVPPADHTFDPSRYYAYLRAGRYASSEARWSKVVEDMQGDAMLVPPFCAVAARVRRADVERVAALWRQPAPSPLFVQDTYDRVEENDEVMDWVGRSLAFRLSAYRHAIDHLQVETPSDQLYEANRAFIALAATRCTDAPAIRTIPQAPGRPARATRRWDPFDGPVLQK